MSQILELINITKKYPGVIANDKVMLNVKKGEVHTLLGENGAGKSTLMSILFGLVKPDTGQIVFKEKEVEINSPKEAISLGIGMVHQHFMLISALTVVDNIILGMADDEEGVLLKTEEAAKKITELSKKYGMEVNPYAKISDLTVGEQQRVEIIKALYKGADLLILDEPTAVLTPQETKDLFIIIKQFISEGKSVIFISHKLNEIMEISDNVTVLRNGKVIGTVETKTTNAKELAKMMVGKEVLFEVEKEKSELGEEVLKVENLRVENSKKLAVVDDLSLNVYSGEILGIAGVDGNGQSELIKSIAGLIENKSGMIKLSNKDITNASPREILDSKLSHIPEDRQTMGLVMDMSIKENVIMLNYKDKNLRKKFLFDWNKVKNLSNKIIKNYRVKCPSADVTVKSLSGGNQQKVIVGRELDRNPDLLLAVHPTRGVDVGAIEFIHKEIVKARDNGCAVLLVSTELDEIMNLSDRIGVLYEGKMMDILNREDATVEKLGLLMAGSKIG